MNINSVRMFKQQDARGAPDPEDPDRAERKISTKFLSGLWRHEELKHDDLNDWQYCGAEWREGFEYHNEFKKQFILACEWPEHKTTCVCDTDIKYNYYVTTRARDRVIVVGKCCIDKFLGPNRKRCEVCYEPHRKRIGNLCDECITKYHAGIVKRHYNGAIDIEMKDYASIARMRDFMSNMRRNVTNTKWQYIERNLPKLKQKDSRELPKQDEELLLYKDNRFDSKYVFYAITHATMKNIGAVCHANVIAK